MLLATIAIQIAALGAPDASVTELQPTIKRGLAYIETRGSAWKDEHHCASCHHIPMMVWTMREAKSAGLSVNEKLLSNTTRWMTSEDNTAGIIPGEKAMNPYSLAAMYAALALHMRPDTASEPAGMPVQFAVHVARNQNVDGAWTAPDGRPPLLRDGESVTLLSELALTVAKSPDFAPMIAKSRAWRSTNSKSDNTDLRSLRLLLAAFDGTEPRGVVQLMDALLARQNADGGWSQSPEMPGDAYATGQALYALATVRCGYRFPASARAIAFLAKSQREDGSWEMVSRPVAQGGGPAKNLEPITYAGSAWAMLGLIRAISLP